MAPRPGPQIPGGCSRGRRFVCGRMGPYGAIIIIIIIIIIISTIIIIISKCLAPPLSLGPTPGIRVIWGHMELLLGVCL